MTRPPSVRGRSPTSAYTWFDFDCDYCTGVYDFGRSHRLVPPHVERRVAAAESEHEPVGQVQLHRQSVANRTAPPAIATITLAWDNLSEVTRGSQDQLVRLPRLQDLEGGELDAPGRLAGSRGGRLVAVGEYRLFRYRNPAMVRRC